MNLYLKRFAILASLILVFCVASYAIEDDTEHDIEGITITTTTQQPAVKQGAPVQIITKDKLDGLGLDDLHEAVRTFSGVTLTDYGGLGGVKTVSVRSLGAHHTAVCYDGVVVSNAQGGQVDIGSFALDNIDEVSLIIGQGDEIFQSARNFESSGVLNIRSSAPKFIDKSVNIGLQMEVGSFGLYNPTLDLATKLCEKWSAKVTGDWMVADGEYPFTLVNNELVTEEIRNNSDVNTFTSEINIYGNIGKKGGKINIKANYLDSERGLPGGVIYYNTTANERLWDKNRFIQANYSTNFNSKWALKSSAKYNYAWNKYADWDSKYQDGYLENQYTQEEYYASGVVKFTPSNNLTFTFAQDIYENKLVTTLDDCPDPYRLSLLSALVGQYKIERFTLTGSLLGVYNHEWALNDTYDIAPDRQHISPSFSLSYKLFDQEDIRVRASFKDAYRVPTFNDLYYSSMGNTNLVPEKAKQYNIGVTYGGRLLPNILDYFTLSVDGYYNTVSDKIVAIPTMFIWKMTNLGEVQIKGVDINTSTYFTLFDAVKFNLSGNYTFQNAIDVTDATAKNYRHQIQYTPRHSGNVMATCNTKWFDVGYTATFVGDRYCLPQNISANLIDKYTDQNINISRTFEFKEFSMKLRAEILNICDVNYDVIKYYPMPGRQYRFTLKINY
ncbi:MAG: TonB-dependent receptor [Rikenellaceae bacterium]